MVTIKLTSKRQATFPKQLCEDLDLNPGDEIEIEQVRRNNQKVWVIKKKAPDLSWVGCFKGYANKKDNSWESIQKSIEVGWAGDKRKYYSD